MKRRATVHPIGIGDEWRRWIAENLVLGSHPDTLVAILGRSGVPAQVARVEIAQALASPYLHGARRLTNRLAKRDWVLGIQARLDRIVPPQVEWRARLSGDVFLREHYVTNRPVIITGMLDDSPARAWTLDTLAERFGTRLVEVQCGRDADPEYEMNSIAHKRVMPFGEYVALIRASGPTNDFYMTANNDGRNRAALDELWQDMPALPDYLNGERKGFFWLGPAGTVTPFHHDLTNNFMMQVMGRKRVRLIAPCETPNLYNHRHCFTPVDGRAIDTQRFPATAGMPIADCVLEPGDILFLPVGWWHHVEALDVSITISATHFRWDNDFYSSYPSNHDF
ncbi:Cupin-like domain-containing protein [Pseudoduganella flava]|uniref:Cupin-like domain-containing protein n=1 Tax=Pseudoduganella flava TaxID=871742 RepID=A0A562PKT4_9BURK|nr:cupin-like domain-containing protein [Pseudoduganella flava]QGZ42424.1 cupin-like domain-containing protein [Pseudoduganella flava]TWI44988.1 Cupin-like domain-containing protein [Pseudoduganella flava]